MTETLILSEEEKKLLSQELSDEEIEKIRRLTLAVQGKSLGDNTIPELLIDSTDIRERSRYPTYAITCLITYLSNIADFNPQAQSCRQWANNLSHALIAYKGLGRQESLDTKKAVQGTTQEFHINEATQAQQGQPMKKAHFWSKTPNQEEKSEFSE